MHMTYGPPPGLSYPHGVSQSPSIGSVHNSNGINVIDGSGSAHGEFVFIPFEGREVSVPSAVLSQCGKSIIGINTPPDPCLPSLSPLYGLFRFAASKKVITHNQ